MRALLAHRAIAVRAVAEACQLVVGGTGQSLDVGPSYDLTNPFVAEFVSAFAEIYNNIVLHAYGRGAEGDIVISLFPRERGLEVVVRDDGRHFEISHVPVPDPDLLPEGGMGLHIARSLLDALIYEPGQPNTWRLRKQLPLGEARRITAPPVA